MNGQIVRYFNNKGYGFIKDEEGKTRFFHASEIDSEDFHIGSKVSFTAKDNEKGLICNNISILENNHNEEKFITLGYTTIKINNIKNFGLHYEKKKKIEKQIRSILKLNKPNKREKLFGDPPRYIHTGDFHFMSVAEYIQYTNEDNNPFILVKNNQGEIESIKINRNDRHGTYYREGSQSVYENVEEPYLYITTYQNDNFKFDKDNYGDVEEAYEYLKTLVNKI